MRAWWRKVKRRKPGIYLVRTDKHRNPLRRENGYVGLSNNWHLRRNDHLGTGRYGAAAKPWSDLNPRWYVLRLPWWLGWKWFLDPLETIAILLLLPRYNHDKNLANPRRVTLRAQQMQRAARDNNPLRLKFERAVASRARRLVQLTGAACLVAAPVGYLLTK